MRLHHLALKTKDPEALAGFYRSVLELEERRRQEDEQGLRSVWLGLGDAILMIERSSSGDERAPSSDDPPGFHLLALAIDPGDAPDWRRRVRVQRESDFTLYFEDPEGNRLALSSWPEPLVR